MNSASIWLKFGILGVKPWNGFGVADETSHLVGYLFSGDDHLSFLFSEAPDFHRPHTLAS
jgi:hypothetical protein